MSPYLSQSIDQYRGQVHLFAKSFGAHAITHVHNGPETVGLGDEAQSADGNG